MAINRIGKTAEIHLGKKIEKLRLSKNVTRKQLGHKINETERQIMKFETGEMLPIPILENIAKVLGEEIPKRIIRRISLLRKVEMETKVEQLELIDLYNEAFHDDAGEI